MPTKHSFEDYVKKNFQSALYNEAEEFVSEHFKELELQTRKIDNVDRAKLEDACIERVYVNNLPNMRISFDVGLSLDIIIFDDSPNSHKKDYCNKWVRITCEGDLSKSLSDFEIKRIVPYEPHRPGVDSLTKNLIPYIEKNQLDSVAEQILKEYYPEALKIPPRGKAPIMVDPMQLASRLGLKVIKRRIKEDSSIFGQMFFSDADTQFYDEKNKTIINEHIEGNTIVIDPTNCLLRNIGSEGNTIVHECVHYLKHRKAFLFERLYNPKISNIGCVSTGYAESSLPKSLVKSIEWQANQLAPRIQMPARPFKEKASECINFYMKQYRSKHAYEVMENSIMVLADSFGVSKQAAKIRLVQLGFDNAIGAYTFLDNHYVKPHGFHNGAIQPNQTFSISAQEAAIERFRNPKLSELTKDGDYLFVENHFVYNAPLYIRKTSSKVELTDYARAHMDECCLIFDISIKSKIAEEYQIDCCLNRESLSYEYEIKFHGDAAILPNKKQVELRKAEKEESAKIAKQMTEDKAQCLKLLMEWRGLSAENLSLDSDVSKRTINRILHEERDADFFTIVKLCFGLHLPPMISEKLLRVFGYVLSPTNISHMWIHEALSVKYCDDIDEVLSFLSEYNVKI